MKIKDLTQMISSNMPVYPGTEPPVITIPCTLEKDGFIEKRISLYSHTGTHMDSPAHILKDGITLDQMPVEYFYGTARVVDVSKAPGPQIDIDNIRRSDYGDIDFVLFYTGWCHKWGKPDYFLNFPVLSLEAADYLQRQEIKGVGIDTISVDPVHSTDFIIHKVFLQNNIVIIENLTNLQDLSGKKFILSCFPLKIASSDGSPVRAVAIYE